jgi:hypothetical protein
MKLNLINSTIREDNRTEYGTMITLNNKADNVRIKYVTYRRVHVIIVAVQRQ